MVSSLSSLPLDADYEANEITLIKKFTKEIKIISII
jgi:hypothetical protein